MSLEQTIADLVAASNNLTGTINTKMNEIDQKVDQATESVPGVMRDKARQIFYVDGVDGDNGNSGTSISPLKDWEGVKDRLIPQFETVVRFRGGQTHIISGAGPNYSGFVDVSSWGYETLGVPTLKMAYDDVRDGKRDGAFLKLSNAVARLTQVRLESQYEGSETLHEAAAFFGRYPGNSTVILDACQVSLKNVPLSHQYPGYATTDFTLRNTSITKETGSDALGVMVANTSGGGEYATTRLDILNVSFTGTDLEEQFRAKVDYSNILSNLDLGA